MKYLDQFVVGQAVAKKVLSVALVSNDPGLLAKLELMTFVAHSVFNHYNRVHANLQSQSDLRYTDWNDYGERMFNSSSMGLALPQYLAPETDPEMTTAQLQPYPRRTRVGPSLFSSGHGLPLFEKSNVLVMYGFKPLVVPLALHRLIPSKGSYRLR